MWETHPEEWAEHQIEMAWAAGLFEGEGCLTISGTQARAAIRCTDEDVIRRFHSIVGFGNYREESSQVNYGYKMQYEWYASSKLDVSILIEALLPFLGNRRNARAKELLAHISDRNMNHGRDWRRKRRNKDQL